MNVDFIDRKSPLPGGILKNTVFEGASRVKDLDAVQ